MRRLLYVNDTVRCLIRVFDVNADGTLGPDRIFASGIRSELEPGVPDGMKCDSAGNIWVTAPGGVWVYGKNGALLGKVRVPELVANLHWGKSDWRTLFMTATHSLYGVRTKIGPHVEPFMRVERRRFQRCGQRAASAPAAAERASGRQGMTLDPSRCALIIQDMQNDVMMDGGAFASSGSPQHAREQNVVENIRRLADAAPRTRRHDHPCLVRRRAGRAGLHAQRAAVRGRCSTPRRWCAAPGAQRRSPALSRSPAISSSKKSA